MVFAECITRREEEDCFQQNKTGIDQIDMPQRAEMNAMAEVRNTCGDKHVGVILKMSIMNFYQQSKCVNARRKLGEIQFWWWKTGGSVKLIDDSPADRGNRHPNSK